MPLASGSMHHEGIACWLLPQAVLNLIRVPFSPGSGNNPWKMVAMKIFSLLLVSLLLTVVLGEKEEGHSR